MRLLHEVGKRVRARRKERALTLKQLAAKSGLSERFIGELEAGRANISVMNLAEVSAVLGIPLSELVHEVSAPAVISLLGLRGAGKSTVGAALAKRLALPFFELDRLVEAEAGMSVSELFALHGEEHFRRHEAAALRKFLERHKRAVLEVGGGVVTNSDTFDLLLRETATVWLKATPEDHWTRVVRQGDLRPMQNRPRAKAELRRRLKEREPLYARASTTCLTSGRSLETVVDQLEAWAGA